MYIELIEELNVGFSTIPSLATQVNDLTESDQSIDSTDLLYVPAEGVHSIVTGNFTYYEPNCLKESVPLWTNPYGIPIIYHHKEQDSKIIGRVKAVEFIKESARTKTPALGFIFAIGDKEGKEGVLNGTLSTLSIGARAKDLRCSICGKNIAKDGFCEHQRGRTYDGKVCYWVVKKIEPKEISYVIVPSDKFAYSEKPLTQQQIKDISISESNNENEVNDLPKNLFGDIFGKALTEAQEEKAKQDAAAAKAKKNTVEKGEDDKKPEPPAEPVEPEKNEPKDEPEVKDPEVKEPKPEPETPEDDKKTEEPDKPDEPKDDEVKDESKEVLFEKIKDMEAKIKELTDDLAYFKSKYKEEKGLRESAERDKIKIENVVKSDLVNKINDLRATFGLTEKDANLQMKSSIDLLESEYNNLSEISNSTVGCVKNINKIQSTALVDDNLDNTNKEIKESEHTPKEQNLNVMFNNFTRR